MHLHTAGRSPAPESQLTTPTSMEVLEVGGGVADEEEGVVLSWGQGGGGSATDPLVISSNDDLEGEDSEVITAFSGECLTTYMICSCVYSRGNKNIPRSDPCMSRILPMVEYLPSCGGLGRGMVGRVVSGSYQH